MPPRRSTRSTSAQPQPPPAVEKPVAKRKRGQPAEDEEQENIKPPSRTRRSSAAPAPRTRAPAKTRQSLEDVPESDEEEEDEDVQPPVKKSRPSLEPEDLDVEEEEDKPTRTRKAPTRKPTVPPSKTGRNGRSTAAKVKEEKEATSRSKGRNSNPPPTKSSSRSSTRATRTTKAVKAPEPDEEEEEEELAVDDGSDDDFEDVKPMPSSSKRRSVAKAKPTSDNEDNSDDPQPVRISKRKPPSRSSALPSSSRGTVRTRTSSGPKLEAKKVIVEVPTDDEGEEETAPAHSPPQSVNAKEEVATPQPAQKQKKKVVIAEDEDEEEHSLLDIPAPSPSKSAVQPAMAEEPQGPKARLVIHKMALVNFKSYAGRQEIGPFHKSFSAIVGPNGSGKSNTIDALLFVFGYRASKMRQGKLSELIHNSARHPDLDECSVEVHFRMIVDLPGPDAYEIVPGSQLVVTRTAYKNNSSRYSINGRQSNYKEVQALLKGRGIDLDHNRFLILQGEVESIAQMKPKAPSEHEDGLLEYLEDIIGTSQYKEPIEEALAEMDRLNEERTEKLNRLKIVERERNALEEEKKEAEDYLRLQNEHVRAKSRLWQWYIWRCLVNEEEFNKTIAQHTQELKAERERNKDDVTHLEMLETHYKERNKTYQEIKEAALAALKDLTAHEKKQVSLVERRKHSAGKLKKLQKSLHDDEHNRKEALRAIESNADKIKKNKSEVERLEGELAGHEKLLEEIRDSLKDKTQVYHDQIESKQKELQPWTAKINAKQAEIDVATSERDMLAKKAVGLKEAYEEAQAFLQSLQEEHEAKETELETLQNEKVSKEKEFQNGEGRLKELQNRVQDLRTKASSSRQKADEAKASQAASTTQSKVLESLTRLKNSGRIHGFHGRLGALGTIPDKYDVAVSTACGALHNMVVDTVEQGQACIEYLRNQSVGRASFMVLEKLSSNGLDKIKTPENVPRLFDLIKPKDPRFAPAFYKGVRDTLVAEDLEQANRIAFGGQRRWRVVTLAGQLIDASGTMSGGGNQVARGGMSSKLANEAVSPEVIRKYEQDSDALAQELEQAQRALRQMELEMDELARAKPQLSLAIEKINLDIQTGTKRIKDAQNRVRELKAKNKPDAGDLARIANLDKEIASAETELASLQDKTSSIEAAIKALEQKIMEIGGARLLGQKSKVDSARLHISVANDEITKAEVAKAKAEKDSNKLESTIASNEAALETVDNEVKELDEELADVTEYINQIRSKVEDAQAAAENSKEDLENLKAELDTKTEEIQAFRQKEMEIEQAIADVKKEAATNEGVLRHWEGKHDELKLEEIDDDDDDEDAENGEAVADGEAPVKPEPGEESKPKKAKQNTTELYEYSVEELATFKKREMIADEQLLDEKLKNLKPNLSVLKDYRKREEEFLRRAQDLDNVTEQRDQQKLTYESLTKQRLDEFMTGFNTISLKLKEMYQMITLGGNAELELVDSMDPFSEGIIFSVMPPKKSWRNISNLSGGEKTLSSLALVFALHVYKPTPLYFMDEIDAALDFRNVSIVANYIKDRTKNAQFIIISLRNDMFELSHRLIGIYKTANATQSISIDNHALHLRANRTSQ